MGRSIGLTGWHIERESSRSLVIGFWDRMKTLWVTVGQDLGGPGPLGFHVAHRRKEEWECEEEWARAGWRPC